MLHLPAILIVQGTIKKIEGLKRFGSQLCIQNHEIFKACIHWKSIRFQTIWEKTKHANQRRMATITGLSCCKWCSVFCVPDDEPDKIICYHSRRETDSTKH
eukprot:scaffold19424_cov142-Cylindrotheca_fusiformis.AAC.10